MEVIEKEKETVKEVPANYWCDRYCGDGYGYGGYGRYGAYGAPFASKGVAGAGLGLGIAGTALGLLALSRGGFGLFGNGCGNNGVPQNVNINTDSINSGMPAYANGIIAPSAFQAWEKSCDDAVALTSAIYQGRITELNEAREAREIDVNEKFQIWKSQVDGDFGLYKSSRDQFDALIAKQNQDTFSLYKNQRDNFDALSARIGALETKQAVSDAVEPWRAKVLDMRINGVAANAHAAVALEAERRCCADNKIVNYVNSTFVPQTIAEPTVGTTTHTEDIYNPLCGCCDPCCNGRTF